MALERSMTRLRRVLSFAASWLRADLVGYTVCALIGHRPTGPRLYAFQRKLEDAFRTPVHPSNRLPNCARCGRGLMYDEQGQERALMTFDDDSIRLDLVYGGRPLIALKQVGMEWPPPERIALVPGETPPIREAREGDHPAAIMHRVSMSAIPDEVRASMTHVFRGADYVYERKLERERAAR